jgi:hypothetical protein
MLRATHTLVKALYIPNKMTLAHPHLNVDNFFEMMPLRLQGAAGDVRRFTRSCEQI